MVVSCHCFMDCGLPVGRSRGGSLAGAHMFGERHPGRQTTFFPAGLQKLNQKKPG
ncbi:hypothetical protein AZ21_0617 [Bordetella bronchiseptica B20-10725633]|nr:hypothetical protein AZ21_0617 [Bordetella bronchiseptica B20-10725633]